MGTISRRCSENSSYARFAGNVAALQTWTKEWRDAMNKQLAHLSYIRDKSWVHYDWVPQLEAEFRIAWREFRRAIDPKHKKRFAREIAKCRRKQGFAGIQL
jgi:hypothetical protein